MTPLVQMDAEDVKQFIHDRLSAHSKFRTVVAVSVQKYPEELFAKVWVGEEPSAEMRQYGYELESELANLGIPCSIIIKSDRELPFGGTYSVPAKSGGFSYRYYRIDPERDEDEVFVFTVFRGERVYRFRISLTGTLASMLRGCNRMEEERILEVYRDWIRQQLDRTELAPDAVNAKMFSSDDLSRFVAS